jgi:HPt (histidine-containing phosphotransfer) domain-containing protein
MMEELFRVFLAEGESMTGRIRAAIAVGSADELLRASHAMRSAVATLGVRSAVDLCSRLESCGRRGDLNRAMTWLRRLERVISAIRVELTATQSHIRLSGLDT